MEGRRNPMSAANPDPGNFEATLAALPPRLAARLSLGPTKDSSPQASSRPSTPSEVGSESSYQSAGSRTQSSGNSARACRHRPKDRSWASSGRLAELENPPGLPLSGQAKGALPSPPYSADVDRSFTQHGQPGRHDAQRKPSSSASPPLLGRAEKPKPGHGSQSAGVTPVQTPARLPKQADHMQIIRANIRPIDTPDQAANCGQRTEVNAMPKMVLSPRLDITASSVSSQPPATAPSEAAPVSPEIEKLQSERALADEQAQQMAMQAQTLLQEKADMAARLAAQERQNRELLQKLEYMEACIAEGGEGASTEEADYYREALAQAEAEKQHIAMMYYHSTGQLPINRLPAS